MEELKPVRCGCGGEAFAHMIGNEIMNGYYICCEECGTKTAVSGTLTEAITAWNRAMGQRTGEWEIEEDYDGDTLYRCPFCESLWTLYDGTPEENEYEYCPKCGAYLKYVPKAEDEDEDE